MYNIDTLKKQHDIERMAREAEKVLGISCALDLALTECREANVEDLAGAFDAMEDIARDLAKDLSEIAEGMNHDH